MSACYCVGPRPGETRCPCQLRENPLFEIGKIMQIANRPTVVAVTTEEGGDWKPVRNGKPGYNTVHAIMFSDGSVWDTRNGWRS
jgi:hypothetical protein